MPRKPSLGHQMHLRMDQMNCLGQSRHLAKLQSGKHRTAGIHSGVTYETYKQTSKEFISWMRINYKEIKDINDITEKHIIEYLIYRQGKELAPITVAKDMAALNKLFNLYLTKKIVGLKQVSYKDITRSRLPRAHDKKYNAENYREQIDIAKATGCRRQSVLKIKPNDFVFDGADPIGVNLKEKGGKHRVATILEAYRSRVKEILEGKDRDKPLFDSYTSKIDNHAFRGEYARDREQELVSKNPSDEYYRGYDKKAIGQVSKDLGHDRLSVVVYHYMR